MVSADAELEIELDGEPVAAPAGPVVTIGRDPSSMVHATGRSVSRRHAVIRFTGGSWELEDVGSSFGTWSGDRPVERVAITDSLEVRLGDRFSGQTLVVQRRPPSGPHQEDHRTGQLPVADLVEAPMGVRTTASGDGTAASREVEAVGAWDLGVAPVAAVGPQGLSVPVGKVPPRSPGGPAVGTRRCSECRAVLPPSQEWCSDCGAHPDLQPVEAGADADEPIHAGVAIHLAEDHLDLVPGEEAVGHVEVRNHGVIVDRFDVGLTGDAAHWSVVDPATVVLWPGSSGEVQIKFRPPRQPSVREGRSVVGVVAVSQTDRAVSATDQATVAVQPFHELGVRLLPQAIRAAGRATFLLVLENRGNAVLDVAIEVTDLTDILDIEVLPPVGLEPGVRREVPLTVTPRTDAPGQVAQPRSFNVNVRSRQGPSADLTGTLLHEPVDHPPAPTDPTATSVAAAGSSSTERPSWVSRLVFEPVALLGALVAAIGAVLASDQLDSWNDDARNVLGGADVWLVVAVAVISAGVLSLVPRTKVIRRLVGLGVLAVVAGLVADIAPRSVAELTTGVVVLAVGGLLLIFSP